MWQVDGAACSLEPPTRDGFDGSLDSRPCVVRCLECTWVRDAVCLYLWVRGWGCWEGAGYCFFFLLRHVSTSVKCRIMLNVNSVLRDTISLPRLWSSREIAKAFSLRACRNERPCRKPFFLLQGPSVHRAICCLSRCGFPCGRVYVCRRWQVRL